ncbi:tetratricopeptide repeat protein [Spirosoma sp. RP8]|uniref:Tetratricopeptide repeat protein n=1 Tax=Spirosoma liriopis TaxID=2937440 RepID=A0ABT0HUZ7_9BACT|nr:adenylate/guanylate cyclase domain-containing protein [Spirosoma liriopis]MCK8496024.1 tetratricopeptide repeat protein [Spirosoma liriopis]
MKLGVCILLSLFLLNGIEIKLYAQPATIKKATLAVKAPKNRNREAADSLFSLGSHCQDTQAYQQSLEMFETSLKLYRLIGDMKKVGDCFNNMAITYFYLGNFSKAIAYFKQGADSFKAIGYNQGVASTLNNIGAVYKNQGNYLKALDSYRQAALVWNELKNAENLAITTQNIGSIYAEARDYGNAMKYYNQAYSVYKEKNNQERIAQVLDEIGKIYTKKARYDKAYEHLHESLLIADKRQDKQLQIMALSSLGNLFHEQSSYARALPYYTRCLTYANQIGSLQSQAEAQIAIGTIMYQLGKSKDAVKKCRNGLQLAEKVGSVSMKKRGCDCLYQSYKAFGNTGQALYYFEQANTLEDSLNLSETANRVMNIEFQKQQLVDSIAYVQKEHIIQLKHKEEVERQEKQRNMIILSLGFILLVAVGLWAQLNYVKKSRAALKVEKDRSEALLLNILPEEIAEELKEKGHVDARVFNLVSILFTDFKSFTQTAEQMSPQSLVEEIHTCFKAFDLIVEKYQIEKIKTIGDAFMAVGGLSYTDERSLKNIVLAGLEMQEFMVKRAVEKRIEGHPAFEMRLGIHTGPIVAGIVGVKKFQYDVWGDTVNTASRMESSGMVGKVNISETLYEFIKQEECFSFEYRGQVHAKGKGEMGMYFVARNEYA